MPLNFPMTRASGAYNDNLSHSSSSIYGLNHLFARGVQARVATFMLHVIRFHHLNKVIWCSRIYQIEMSLMLEQK